ncbi:MAG: hypothetical protein IT342_03920 [Candidatus Melainabacteria bacterium]|nr:hypothetical protein [Candidatus Melainabacteria bacterium]
MNFFLLCNTLSALICVLSWVFLPQNTAAWVLILAVNALNLILFAPREGLPTIRSGLLVCSAGLTASLCYWHHDHAGWILLVASVIGLHTLPVIYKETLRLRKYPPAPAAPSKSSTNFPEKGKRK